MIIVLALLLLGGCAGKEEAPTVMDRIRAAGSARLELPDGSVVLVKDEIESLRGFAGLGLVETPLEPADCEEDWRFRIIFDPEESKAGAEPIVVGIHADYVQIGEEFYTLKEGADFSLVLDWAKERFSALLGRAEPVPDKPVTEAEKPVIYLYPAEPTEVTVRLDYDGALSCTYPAYDGGWTVTAEPDGTLTDAQGQEYNYLYWEGSSAQDFDFSEGFCVRGEETAAFLDRALAELGLTRREANEFIVYWLPRMEQNAWNLISFQGEAYTARARLEITPRPDTVFRVFMAWKALDAPVELPAQNLKATERNGFTVVEWGGSEVGP